MPQHFNIIHELNITKTAADNVGSMDQSVVSDRLNMIELLTVFVAWGPVSDAMTMTVDCHWHCL